MNNSKPKVLYHYTTIQKAIEGILPNFSLFMNSISHMNDPTENLLHESDPFKFQKSPLRNYDPMKMFSADFFRYETKITCFTINKDFEKDVTVGFKLQRMWAQYGGGNTGICLEIDYNTFIEENKAIISDLNIIDDFVSYNDNTLKLLPTIKSGMAEINDLTYENCKNVWLDFKKDNLKIRERFFTKNTDWKDEREYRFLVFIKGGNKTLSIRSSLRKVYTGVHFSKHYLPSLHELLTNGNDVYISSLVQNNYGVLTERNY